MVFLSRDSKTIDWLAWTYPWLWGNIRYDLFGYFISKTVCLGGGVFGFLTKPKTASQRALIIFIGFLLQIVCYYLAFVNFPSDASSIETNKKPYFDFR